MTLSKQPLSALCGFHPAVAAWFTRQFDHVTPAQARTWPLIQAGQSVLLAAPTGSGKTLSAFFAVLDELVHQGLAAEDGLPDHTQVVYVSPLKALSNDIQLNLQRPLEGIAQTLGAQGLAAPRITTAVRTGDTPQAARAAMRRKAPHILVTTPESLYVLLGSASGRAGLATVHTVIVDEIHAVAGNKRGCHLALTLERLEAVCDRPLRRIGLSATQRPVEQVARLLVGHARPCAIVDIGHARPRDLALELPPVPLGAVLSSEDWRLVYDRLAELARQHTTTLVFVNTRRLAERLARHLGERLGVAQVAAHHGSLARTHRLEVEQRLKRGDLQVLVATASLELGIDIGDVDLVCQIASPGSIAAFLQRVGRAGHQVDGTSKGRLFATSRDDLIECVALLDCVRRGELDVLHIPRAPLDVLAQQIVAEVSNQAWTESALLDCLRRAEPYAELEERDYQAVLRMLADGHLSPQGVRGAYVQRDAVSGELRGRRGSQLAALTSGGTLPDSADYAVILDPQALNIGSVNEDFAVESTAGDIVQLGNASYRILRVEPGRVRVEEAHGLSPTIPFWIGETPGRSTELSAAVARFQAAFDRQLTESGGDRALALAWLREHSRLEADAAVQVFDYLGRAWAALGALPSQDTLVLERVLDVAGDPYLILHAPFGSRVNRAWGLALRARLGRLFDIDLHVAAGEDALVFALPAAAHAALTDLWQCLPSATAESILVQAVLDAPLFDVRWRWNAAVAMALPRMIAGRKVAPQVQRLKSQALVEAVFPELAETATPFAERPLPDHPLVRQTLDDCLHEAMDSTGWLALLRRIEQAELRLIGLELATPSPLALARLDAKPYALADDAPTAERRAQALLNRRWQAPASAEALGLLDPEAIETTRGRAWPSPRTPDELHDALMTLGAITEQEALGAPDWRPLLDTLVQAGRAVCLHADGLRLWFARERLPVGQAVYPHADIQPPFSPLPGFDRPLTHASAVLDLLRARLGGLGPVTLEQLRAPLGLSAAATGHALAQLEAEGQVLQGLFTPGTPAPQWCERHLLGRIHRDTIKRLRREIEPVGVQDYLRFLLDWQHVSDDTRLRGPQAVDEALDRLEGFPCAAAAWEAELLPMRVGAYAAHQLDQACQAGRWAWCRLATQTAASLVPGTPLLLIPRSALTLWQALGQAPAWDQLGTRAQKVQGVLQAQGPLRFDELLRHARLLPSELETALQALVGSGLVTAERFIGLRGLITPSSKRTSRQRGRGLVPLSSSLDLAGRWTLLDRADDDRHPSPTQVEHIAWALLRRYGVVCWRLLARESDALPPWRELLRCYHRLEARGEIRGGRFIADLAGEQFALPEALTALRQVRQRAPDGRLAVVSACDPLNLLGSVLPGAKVPAMGSNRLLYRDGLPVAVRVNNRYRALVDADPDTQRRWQERLLKPVSWFD
ncbi:DEAD/DEAH box helicase [Pseudomonas entomophila]|uniref:DEAD/DEAH box helicase n=1 Tax=Pseudomonas entomophila TaxID=312306 RepID=UPI0015E47F71|nr:DEAD/DEAH box helicase [Pseudomonas entomophila]MBA1188489.1 DEAD/DEAH box helicase [Pseudomonas entomophila]